VSQVSFEEILKAWVLEYDERLPSDRRARREAFIVLFGNLQDHGFGKEELNSGRKEKIVRSCVNPNHKDKKRLKRWVSMVLNDLDMAILVYYGTVKIRRDVVTPEMSAKLESMETKAAEVKALRKPDSEEAESEEDDSDKPLDLEETPLSFEQEKAKPLNDPKVVVTPDEVLEQMSGPEAQWDEALIKELGIKIYE
jgi:hypothetical protein